MRDRELRFNRDPTILCGVKELDIVDRYTYLLFTIYLLGDMVPDSRKLVVFGREAFPFRY